MVNYRNNNSNNKNDNSDRINESLQFYVLQYFPLK